MNATPSEVRLTAAEARFLAQRNRIVRESWNDLLAALDAGEPFMSASALWWMLKVGVGHTLFLLTAPMRARLIVWKAGG